MTTSASDAYTGIDNLEIMASAVNYLRHLNDSIAAVAGPPSAAPRLVDFGAGTGTHAIAMRDRGYDVACIEIDPTLQSMLRGEGLTVGDAPSAFEPASFDLAYTMNVIEHIVDDEQALASLVNCVRPGGRLVVFVPAFPVLYSSMDEKVGHVRRYRRRGLVDVVTRAGFVVDRCQYVDSLGFPATLAYKALGSRKGDLGEGSLGFYDRVIFPLSRGLDRGLSRVVGKNLLLVATRPVGPPSGR